MPQKCETPLAGGASRNSLAAFRNPDSLLPKAGQPFTDHRQAALTLLNGGFRLTRKAGQFLGQLAVDAMPMSAKQHDWLATMLDKHGLPPLAREEGQ